MLVLLDGASPEVLGTLVRALLPQHPDLDVVADLPDLEDIPNGSTIIYCPHPSQAEWLNMARPLFAERQLKVLLFCSSEVSAALAHRAPDFFNWISHRIECPKGHYLPAVRGLRAAVCHRALGVSWHGGDFAPIFAEALPKRSLTVLSSSISYDSMVEAMHTHRRGWLGWTDVDGPFRLRRVRWAMAEVGRRGRVALLSPTEATPGFWPLRGRPLPIAKSIRYLKNVGVPKPGRLAALLDLEDDALKIAARLVRAKVDIGPLETMLATSADGGRDVAKVALEQGIEPQKRLLPTLRAGCQRGWQRGADEVEMDLRSKRKSERLWSERTDLAINEGDIEIGERWSNKALAFDVDQVEARYCVALALLGRGRLTEAEHALRDVTNLRKGQREQWKSLAELAETLSRMGKSNEALECLSEAISILVAVPTQTSTTSQPKKDDSVEHLTNILRRWPPTVGQENLLPLGQKMAMILMDRGDHAQAEQLLRQLLDVENKIPSKRRHFITSRAMLAWTLYRSKRYAEATKHAKRALADTESHFGREHPYVAICLYAASKLLEHTQPKDAESHLRRALALRERLFGKSDPSYTDTLYALGVVLSKIGRFEEAERTLVKVKQLRERALGDTHTDVAATSRALALLDQLRGTTKI